MRFLPVLNSLFPTASEPAAETDFFISSLFQGGFFHVTMWQLTNAAELKKYLNFKKLF